MAPISIDRLVRELDELKQLMDAGSLKTSEYDQRLARVITELRDRKIDADRPTIQQTLTDLLAKGTITPAVKDHIEKRLGL
jgi:hypothetical protein